MQHPLRYLLLGLSLLMLAACSSSPIKLYAGPSQPAADIATVKVPVELDILSLNGNKVEAAHTLLGTKDQQLQLLPGDYKLLVYYNNIWKTEGKSHEKIKSAPILFKLSLAAGHSYKIDFKHAANRQQAEAFRQHFSAWITDTTTGKRTSSQPSGLALDDSLIAQLTGKVKTVSVGAADASGNQVIAPLGQPSSISTKASTSEPATTATQPSKPAADNYLTLLKAQWQQASQAEKRAFLQWVSHH